MAKLIYLGGASSQKHLHILLKYRDICPQELWSGYLPIFKQVTAGKNDGARRLKVKNCLYSQNGLQQVGTLLSYSNDHPLEESESVYMSQAMFKPDASIVILKLFIPIILFTSLLLKTYIKHFMKTI